MTKRTIKLTQYKLFKCKEYNIIGYLGKEKNLSDLSMVLLTYRHQLKNKKTGNKKVTSFKPTLRIHRSLFCSFSDHRQFTNFSTSTPIHNTDKYLKL
jgi:UDP-N-acetylmuramoylalanine-D-glutamate ligase